MASKPEDHLCCPVCHDVFKEPVLLSCSHSFCQSCVRNWWRQRPTRECPICKTRSQNKKPPSNLVMKNLCQDFLKQRHERSAEGGAPCSQPSKKPRLSTSEQEQAAWLLGRESEQQQSQQPQPSQQQTPDLAQRPINDASQQRKKQLRDTLGRLKNKLKRFKKVKEAIDSTTKHITDQTEHTERKIKEQFLKFHRFLEEEEEARMAALKVEEDQKTLAIMEKIEALSRDIASLSDSVKDTEEELGAEDVPFLLNYKALDDRIQQRLLLDDPQQQSELQIDEAKHLGNLTFHLWNKMKNMIFYSPAVLDPNSAGQCLLLSDNLTSMRRRERQKLPTNPERFINCQTVRGCEGFNSGAHSWDIYVGDNVNWGVGVVAQSHTKRMTTWKIGICRGQYTVSGPAEPPPITSTRRFQKIRVKLDWNGGYLSFSDPDTDSHIYTFTHRFTEKIFPYFYTEKALRLLPMDIDVTMEQRL